MTEIYPTSIKLKDAANSTLSVEIPDTGGGSDDSTNKNMFKLIGRVLNTTFTISSVDLHTTVGCDRDSILLAVGIVVLKEHFKYLLRETTGSALVSSAAPKRVNTFFQGRKNSSWSVYSEFIKREFKPLSKIELIEVCNYFGMRGSYGEIAVERVGLLRHAIEAVSRRAIMFRKTSGIISRREDDSSSLPLDATFDGIVKDLMEYTLSGKQ